MDIVERLESVNRQFPVALELGAARGAFAEALATSQAAAKIGMLVQADLSAGMLSGRSGIRVVADDERSPFAQGAVDLAVSSLCLHWVDDLVGALIQIRRAMKADGLFIGALLGGATLNELRQALLEAEAELCGGAGPRISPFTDAFGAAGLLQRAGFALPVVDTDRLTVRYRHPLELIADLRGMGESSALVDRPQWRLSARVLSRACEIYIARHTGADARIEATFEIITLTGWAPHPGQPKPLQPGSATVHLAEALGRRH